MTKLALMDRSIPRDVQEFLDNYPDVGDDPLANANLAFYSNKIRCEPDAVTIEQIHEEWVISDILGVKICPHKCCPLFLGGFWTTEDWNISTATFNGCRSTKDRGLDVRDPRHLTPSLCPLQVPYTRIWSERVFPASATPRDTSDGHRS